MRLPSLLFPLALIAFACGKDEEVCTDYEPPPGFDLQNPAVKFNAEVMPIFKNSCTFSQCHNKGNRNGVTLEGDADTIHRGIVSVRASELSKMDFVKPGDPHESFLMRKLDASHCVLDAQCVNGDCGAAMPRNDDRLGEDQRHVIRRWIAQGAKND
jgi:hypothetical protein